MPDETGVPGAIFDELPKEIQIGIATKCNSQACKDAKNDVITARNNVITACTDVDRFSSDRTFFAALAATFWAAAAVTAGAGAAAPWPLNLILFLVAAALAVVAIIMSIYAADFTLKVSAAKAVLAAEQQKFKDAAAAVIQHCDNFCYPNLTVPTC